MHDPLDYLNSIAEKARSEEVPKTNVTNDVLHRIKARESDSESMMFIFALGSVCAALVSIMFGLSAWGLLTDPLSILFQVIPTISL